MSLRTCTARFYDNNSLYCQQHDAQLAALKATLLAQTASIDIVQFSDTYEVMRVHALCATYTQKRIPNLTAM